MIINGTVTGRGGYAFGSFAIIWGITVGLLASRTFMVGRVRTHGRRTPGTA